MQRSAVDKFIKGLKKEFQVFGPLQKDGDVYIEPIDEPEKIVWDNILPYYSAKNFFVPQCEVMFRYNQNHLKKETTIAPKNAVIINIMDLKALPLYDLVFKNDIYYQARRESTLVIGYGKNPNEAYLEHVPFDIFVGKLARDEFKLFSGSEKGRTLLKTLKEPAPHIKYAGPEIDNDRFAQIHEKMKRHHNPAVWEELGKKCIECGKCTVACPTCFCFKIDDQPSLKSGLGERKRSLDSCFYDEFSLMAGGAKSLKTTAQKINFWYTHKFIRIPEQYKAYLGCYECMRCFKVCPVGINIQETFQRILID